MHTKWTTGGRGSAKKASDYPFLKHDFEGKPREYIELLAGDPDRFAELAESLPYKNRWSHAVISWAPGDNPTPAQKREVLDEFVKLATAGFEPDQYYYMAVDHGDHLHIYFPRVELRTGKAWNPAPPKWENIYDPFRDYFNLKYGWRSPDIEAHPENARLSSPGKIHVPKSHAKAKEAIAHHIDQLIAAGVLTNREEVIQELEKGLGLKIARVTKKSISVQVPGLEKNVRLKGVAYEEAFDLERVRAAVREQIKRAASKSEDDRRAELEGLEERLRKIIEGRAKYHQGRYRKRRGGDNGGGPGGNKQGPIQDRGVQGEDRGPGGRQSEESTRERSLDKTGSPGNNGPGDVYSGDSVHQGIFAPGNQTPDTRSGEDRPGAERQSVVPGRSDPGHSFQDIIKRYYRLSAIDPLSYYVTRTKKGAKIENKKDGVDVEDEGTRIVARGQNYEEQARIMIEMAEVKGWNLGRIKVGGPIEFQDVALRLIREEIERKINDRVRERIEQSIGATRERIEQSIGATRKKLYSDIEEALLRVRENYERAESEVSGNTRRAEAYHREAEQHHRRADETITALRRGSERREATKRAGKIAAKIREFGAAIFGAKGLHGTIIQRIGRLFELIDQKTGRGPGTRPDLVKEQEKKPEKPKKTRGYKRKM